MYGQHDHARMLRGLAMSRVGDKIRERREKAGMTLRALARIIDVSPPFLSDVEHGRRTTTKLAEIENALKLKRGSLWAVAGLCRHCGGTGLRDHEKGGGA
jgi:ribosome-binding protein aMBF1 (putative translation factor)